MNLSPLMLILVRSRMLQHFNILKNVLIFHSMRRLNTLLNHLQRGPPEPHQPSAPQPSRTSSAICARTLRRLISHLHGNPAEPHQPCAPEPSATSSTICTRSPRNLISHLHKTLRNPTSHLHRNPPKPTRTCSGTWRCSCTSAPELFWEFHFFSLNVAHHLQGQSHGGVWHPSL